jgi:hypothetical protein
MGYLNSMELTGAKDTYHDASNGQVYTTPSISIEPREQELVPDNGPFMKILTGSLSRKAVIVLPTTQPPISV